MHTDSCHIQIQFVHFRPIRQWPVHRPIVHFLIVVVRFRPQGSFSAAFVAHDPYQVVDDDTRHNSQDSNEQERSNIGVRLVRYGTEDDDHDAQGGDGGCCAAHESCKPVSIVVVVYGTKEDGAQPRAGRCDDREICGEYLIWTPPMRGCSHRKDEEGQYADGHANPVTPCRGKQGIEDRAAAAWAMVFRIVAMVRPATVAVAVVGVD
mmetsp:Transcript_23915/g.66836  ORF Transcript_23915/g.66836 Transcript_23915/m.66836 type:complete len:207 (-) Transcript_23915:190-810(-)